MGVWVFVFHVGVNMFACKKQGKKMHCTLTCGVFKFLLFIGGKNVSFRYCISDCACVCMCVYVRISSFVFSLLGLLVCA